MPRPPDCEPGSITDAAYLAERLRVSRERLMASELASQARAWRLWSVCVAQTFDYGRAADTIYVVELARLAGMDRSAAGRLMRRFNELGIFGWDPAPRGSRTRVMSRVSIPEAHAASAPHYRTMCHRNEVMTYVEGCQNTLRVWKAREPRPSRTRPPRASSARCPG
mgnify:FL=1